MLNVVTALNACSLTVEKNKSRTSSRNQHPPTNGQPDLVPPESKSRNVEYYKALCEKNQTIQQLENTLRSNNRRFEAAAVVIKHLCAGVSIVRLHLRSRMVHQELKHRCEYYMKMVSLISCQVRVRFLWLGLDI